MIRRARYILATAGSVAILAGGMTLAGAGAASAATLPSCAANVKCNNNFGGAAGYNGADDNHTHYRYVQTETTAAPQLFNLNGLGNNLGSSGVSLCDENTGQVAQLSLTSTSPGVFKLVWGIGRYLTAAADSCVSPASAATLFRSDQLLNLTGINAGDTIVLSIAYNQGRHPTIKFSACDLTSPAGGVCRSATHHVGAKSYTEFGIGAFTLNHALTSPPNNPLAAYGLNQVACYACANPINITLVSPVNPFNLGGLFESQLLNVRSLPVMSPLDSLSATTDAFGIQSGSFPG